MTGRPPNLDLANEYGVYQGDDWTVPCIMGRSIDDGVLVEGSPTLTSEAGDFSAADVSVEVIAYTLDDANNATIVTDLLPDETLIASVESEGSCTLSANALRSLDGAFLAIARLDVTDYTFESHIRGTAKAADKLAELDIAVEDAVAGRLTWSMDPATTSDLVGALRSGAGVWDLKVTDADGAVATFAQGQVAVEPNKTRGS